MTETSAQPQAKPDAGNEVVVREKVVDVLRTIFDPEIPVNIFEMGLIYEVTVAPGGAVAEELPAEVEFKTRAVAGVTSVELDLVWDPPWSPDMMTEAAKLELGML
jgi:metal-sulfur cluster biosynthetic enzyme